MPTSTPFRPVTIQLPRELYARLSELADREQRSISNMLRVIATRYLDDRDTPAGEGEPVHPVG